MGLAMLFYIHLYSSVLILRIMRMLMVLCLVWCSSCNIYAVCIVCSFGFDYVLRLQACSEAAVFI